MSSGKEPPEGDDKKAACEIKTRDDATSDDNNNDGGKKMPPLSALQRAAAADELLVDCIAARADLGVLTSRRMKEWGQAGDGCGTASAVSGGANTGKAAEEVAAAARTFSEKMAELAVLAPELSRLLEELTRATPASGVDNDPARQESGNDPGMVSSSISVSADKFKDFEDFIKAVLAPLVHLLSFDHIRASSSTAHTLVQALVNLSVGLARAPDGAASQACNGSAGSSSASGKAGSSPSLSQQERVVKKAESWALDILAQVFAPKVYGGKLVRSARLDALLWEHGVDASGHHRAVQVELARNALALQGLAGDMLLSKRRQASRKRARPQQTNHVDDSDNIKSFTSPEPSSNAESGSPPSSGGFERLFGDSGVVALEAALGQGYMGGENKDAAESLFENTVKAFCCMAGGGAGEDRPPMQALHSRLLLDSYRLLAAPERSEWNRPPLSGFPSTFPEFSGATTDLPPPKGSGSSMPCCHKGKKVDHARQGEGTSSAAASSASSSSASPSSVASLACWPTMGMNSSFFETPFPLPQVPPSPPHVSPHPAEWERHVRGCLALLRRRPLLCPEELLKRTGLVPCFAFGASVGSPDLHGKRAAGFEPWLSGGGAGWGGVIDSLAEGLEGSSGRHKFHITEACLFIALDLTEEALLDESVGEAAAGLLRAWCTGTKAGSRGEGVALAGGDRWKEERGVMSPLIALLDETPSVCPDSSIGGLVWALQDMSQKYGDTESPTSADGSVLQPWRAFGTELWLLLVGYRHWQMVAMLQLLSMGGCVLCERMKPKTAVKLVRNKAATTETAQNPPLDGDHLRQQQEDQREGPSWLLAWFACGGVGSRQRIQRTQNAIDSAAAELTAFHFYIPSAGVRTARGDGGTAAEALRRAGQAGEGLVESIFGPCMAIAWLLVSSVDVDHCENVLGTVLRSEDLDRAFGSGDSSEEDTREACDGVLQGLAALEDMLWLCKLDRPLSHVHAGRKLFRILGRVKAWLSGIKRREPVGAGSNVANNSSSSNSSRRNPESKSCCNNSLTDAMWQDFAARRDCLCHRLQDVLVANGAR